MEGIEKQLRDQIRQWRLQCAISDKQLAQAEEQNHQLRQRISHLEDRLESQSPPAESES